ncbi:uncharacterized protein [Drosophila kikkawai]|uniref:Uncharacterized protein n=1 Tax=Drosophila kikkawai TaxID=30033 RepID=A0A6P4I8G6_DROKI|nr:uncharacterized protein LOC108073179 [Drosophila kikkawai]
MVNLQGNTRMMVNRYIELLRARIQCAPTRHIAERHRRVPYKRRQYSEQAVREREKADSYHKNKRRSMWEQTQSYGGRFSEPEDHKRVDSNQYRPKKLEQRRYNCTWNDFPKKVVEKQCNPYTPPLEEEAPKRRRSPGDRPNTARPFDDEAAAFINQWDSNTAMINRNKYVRSTDSCPTPLVNRDFECILPDRKRMFQY